MKRLIGLLIAVMMLSGCLIVGQGSTIGFVTTVEDTSLMFGWDTVWFRVETGTYSSMQSQPEPYAIQTECVKLKGELLDTCRKNQKIELIYKRHAFMAHGKARGEVIGFNVIQ